MMIMMKKKERTERKRENLKFVLILLFQY